MTTTEMRLGDVCDFQYGNSLPEATRKPGLIPVYGSNGKVGQHDQAVTTGATLIIGRKGSIGEVHYSPVPCFPIDTTYYVEKTKRSADLRWLYYALLALDLTQLNKSAAVPGLNRDDAYESRLFVPALPDQRRLATLLNKADHLCRTRRYALQLSDTFLQSVFLEMFGDPATNPKGWDIRPLRTLSIKFSDGPFGSNLKSEHYAERGVRVIRLQNVGVGEFIDVDRAYISPTHFAELIQHRCLPGDVIAGTMGDPNLRAFVIPATLPESLNKADCVQIRPDTRKAVPAYICWLLNTPGTLVAAAGAVLGQTRSRVSMGRLAEFVVPLPPLTLQEQFAQIVRRMERLSAQQREAERQAEHLFQTLLHRAFRGEV